MKKIITGLLVGAALLVSGGVAQAAPTTQPPSTPVAVAQAKANAVQRISSPAGVAAGNTCNAPHGSRGLWSPTNDVAYVLSPTDIGRAPAWCINNNGSRTVIQQNGALVVYNREGSGGTAVWKSTGYNKGATLFRFQHDGNMVFYSGYGDALWAASWTWGSITRWESCATGYFADTYTNRFVWSAHTTGVNCWLNGGRNSTFNYTFPA